MAKQENFVVYDSRRGKVFATEKEARDYAQEHLEKTREVLAIERTKRKVTHKYQRLPQVRPEFIYDTKNLPKPKTKPSKDKVLEQRSQTLKSKTGAKVPSQQAASKTYTVKAGRSVRTFATKAEAQEYANQCRNRNVSITSGTRKPTHRVVSFTAKK